MQRKPGMAGASEIWRLGGEREEGGARREEDRENEREGGVRRGKRRRGRELQGETRRKTNQASRGAREGDLM
eukprot:759302-Hanusia_phi.AAC.1